MIVLMGLWYVVVVVIEGFDIGIGIRWDIMYLHYPSGDLCSLLSQPSNQLTSLRPSEIPSR
jgi:hypothetical protein